MTFELVEEFKLGSNDASQIREQLFACFGEAAYLKRVYYKQRAHNRLILKEESRIIAQMGLDFRAMRLGDEVIQVLGIIDFTVLPELQGKGLGDKMLKEVDRLALSFSHNIDFLLLAADMHNIYLNNGFRLVQQNVKWLGINEHEIVGLLEREMDSILIKPVGLKKWNEHATLEMLGYMY